MSAPLALTLDGGAVDPESAALPPTERGFTYGDGLFETIPAPGGRAFEATRHFARLRASAKALGLPVPPLDALEAALAATLEAAGAAAGVARVTWSRGRGDRGFAPGADSGPPRLVVAAYPPPEVPPAGQGVRALSVRGVTPGELARHKTLSAIHYVVAAQRARAAGADEALLVDPRGRVLETAGANIFAVLGGRVLTPPASLPLFAGIGRERTRDALAARHPGLLLEQAFDLAALGRAEEAFLASAVRGIVPLVAVDGRTIGAGVPGPMTTGLTLSPGSA
ncbi:MAG: aminotransferase class IV [Candidatus Eisenbacteria bacterium]